MKMTRILFMCENRSRLGLTPSSDRARACTWFVRSLIEREFAQKGAGYLYTGNYWSGRWDLNPRQLAWEARTLPLSYARSTTPERNPTMALTSSQGSPLVIRARP